MPIDEVNAALLNSAVKFDSLVYMGNVINIKIARSAMNTDEKLDMIVVLIRSKKQKSTVNKLQKYQTGHFFRNVPFFF